MEQRGRKARWENSIRSFVGNVLMTECRAFDSYDW